MSIPTSWSAETMHRRDEASTLQPTPPGQPSRVDSRQSPASHPQASIRAMFAWAPWSLARGTATGRRAVLLLVLAALLYGFGMHAARACAPSTSMPAHHAAAVGGQPCHGEHVVDVAEAACEAHCRADTQSGRLSFSFDLPAAAPLKERARMIVPWPPGAEPAFRRSGAVRGLFFVFVLVPAGLV